MGNEGCSDDAEFDEYLNNHSLLLISLRNYIDYENVEPGIGPLNQHLQFNDRVNVT